MRIIILGQPLRENERTSEDVLHSRDVCTHKWVMCRHTTHTSKGSNKKCKGNDGFAGAHYICRLCAKDRYSDRWGAKVDKILFKRRDWIAAGFKSVLLKTIGQKQTHIHFAFLDCRKPDNM